jgi:hypothetical protein
MIEKMITAAGLLTFPTGPHPWITPGDGGGGVGATGCDAPGSDTGSDTGSGGGRSDDGDSDGGNESVMKSLPQASTNQQSKKPRAK